jgi:hypothetical protein
MWRQAGGVQGQIMMALRFFGLIDENDAPTPGLQRLVAPENKERRPEHIKALLRHAYRDILEHDLTRMTPKMLLEFMEQYNVQGDTRRKAMAFFLRAATYADLPMHPLLAAQIRNTAPVRRKRKKNAEPDLNGVAENPLGTQVQQTGSSNARTKVIKLASGTAITLTIDANWLEMSTAERDYVFGLVDKLQKVPGGVGEQAAV